VKALFAAKEGCDDEIIAITTLERIKFLLSGYFAYRRGLERVRDLRLAGLKLAAGPSVAATPDTALQNSDLLPSK
jgi:hypothetical protein